MAALGAADGGVLGGHPALAPRHSLHLPLLLLVREGALPLLALRRCEDTEGSEASQISSGTDLQRAAAKTQEIEVIGRRRAGICSSKMEASWRC